MKMKITCWSLPSMVPPIMSSKPFASFSGSNAWKMNPMNPNPAELDYYQDDDGTWVIRGRLPQEEGGLVVKALEEIVDKQMVVARKNVSAETPRLHMDETPKKEETTFAEKRADALCHIAEHFIASGHGKNGQPLAGHERCQIMLHIDAKTLKQDHCCNHDHTEKADINQEPAPPDAPELDDNWISLKNAKRLCCDATLLTALEDEDGSILNVGRKTRTVPSKLKRALDKRDPTCRFPGCCESHYVDFHHIQHWAEGGETNKENLIKLCRFHHRELHFGHFTIESTSNRR